MSVLTDHAEFSITVLVSLKRYKPKLARAIPHECQDDLRIGGWDAVMSRWRSFINC